MKKILLSLLVFIIIIFLINFDQLRIDIVTNLVISRGVIFVNCFWYKITELFFTDGSGINVYNDLKAKHGDFCRVKVFGKDSYLVTNINHIKYILDNSPYIFNVGELKLKFFKTFMEKNVGVSGGCPWMRRRKIKDFVLNTDKLPHYSHNYNLLIENQLKQLLTNKTNTIKFNDLINFGRKIVSKIVFNEEEIHDDIFKMFAEANNVDVFSNDNFKVNKQILDNYTQKLKYHIDNPQKGSLIELCLKVSKNKEEIFHQIPHFIFPIFGLFLTSMPRLLILLCNHRNIFDKIINEIYDNDVYNLGYLRKCIMETVRLNNPVVSLFRTLEKDLYIGNRFFTKGTQLLLLTNPVLRQGDYFEDGSKFKPERWTKELENKTYAISFSQGPQKCPGKELAIFLIQSFVYNFIKLYKIGRSNNLVCNKRLNNNNIKQVINTCNVKFTIEKN